MSTVSEAVSSHMTETTTTAGTAQTTLTASVVAPVAAAAPTTEMSQAGPSQERSEAPPPSAQQIDDLNFYLRRMTLGGDGEMSQIETYEGGPDYEMFLDAVGSVGTQHGWTEARMVRTVEMKLKDKAREYYGALLPVERPTTMVGMRGWFRRVFGRKLTMSAGKRELEMCIRNPGESLGEYAQRLKIVANKMFPADSLTTRERLYHRNLLLVNQFIEGLEGRLANEVLRAGEFYNLDDCLEVAEHCEAIVSRMIPETRYDIRMSTIRRVEANHGGIGGHEQPIQLETARSEASSFLGGHPQQAATNLRRFDGRSNQIRQGRQERRVQPAWNGRLQQGQDRRLQGNNQQSGRNLGQAGQQVEGVNGAASAYVQFLEKYPYMKNRCRRCGKEGHFAIGCQSLRKLFCFHCGKENERCFLNYQRPTVQRPV